MPMPRLLNLNLRPSRFDLLLDFLGFGLGHAFLDRLRRAFCQRFCFSQTKTRHRAAHFLDDANLVRAHFFQDHLESRFLFRCRSGGATAATACRGCRHRHRSRCAHAPFLFQLFHQSSNLEHRQAAQLLHDFVCICHFVFLSSPLTEAPVKLSPKALRPDVFRFHFIVGQPPRLPRQAMRPPYKISYALASVGFPSFCAFAFNNLANDAAGSFNNRTNFVAGDNSNPSNCASKTSRDGKSASTSISFADKTELSTTPIFSAAILNSAANVFKIFATGATSFSPTTIAV